MRCTPACGKVLPEVVWNSVGVVTRTDPSIAVLAKVSAIFSVIVVEVNTDWNEKLLTFSVLFAVVVVRGSLPVSVIVSVPVPIPVSETVKLPVVVASEEPVQLKVKLMVDVAPKVLAVDVIFEIVTVPFTDSPERSEQALKVYVTEVALVKSSVKVPLTVQLEVVATPARIADGDWRYWLARSICRDMNWLKTWVFGSALLCAPADCTKKPAWPEVCKAADVVAPVTL